MQEKVKIKALNLDSGNPGLAFSAFQKIVPFLSIINVPVHTEYERN